jgi:hypothetical protein
VAAVAAVAAVVAAAVVAAVDVGADRGATGRLHEARATQSMNGAG